MASSGELCSQILSGAQDGALARLYGQDPATLTRQRARYAAALQGFARYFGAGRQVRVYSAPGRVELGGNHTDHQNGLGLAAAVDLDVIAVASATAAPYIRVKSYGFDKLDVVDVSGSGPQQAENTHSASLIRGIAQALTARGGQVGGVDAYTASDVLRGSGLSSSAAFEMVIAAILNSEYCQGRFSPLVLAQISQYAENCYFGKPSGLLDPLACAMGGVICADFAQPQAPQVRQVRAQRQGWNCRLCVTDTGGSHSEMTGAFAAVRAEMEAVARCLGGQVLRQVPEQQVLARLPALRRACGDRAVLRALHFYGENRRVQQACACLEAGDEAGFLRCVAESGHSAFEYNQNAYCADAPSYQPIPVALAVSQTVLGGRGAFRLQGTGFAGTIQAFVPGELLADYRAAMDGVFGQGSCRVLSVRSQGCVQVLG